MNWKAFAIVLIIIQVLQVAWVGAGYYLIEKERQDTNYCYYTICEGFPEATLDLDVCSCYEHDLLGDFVIVKTEVIK